MENLLRCNTYFSINFGGNVPDIIEGIVMGGGNLRMLKFNKNSNFVLKQFYFYNTIDAFMHIISAISILYI